MSSAMSDPWLAQQRMQAIVAAFQAPAPSTQAAFLFHATETLNPCMWATDFDQSQVDFAAFPGQPPCLNCKVRLHMRVLSLRPDDGDLCPGMCVGPNHSFT